jgi:large subunit ribosomal protein L15
MVSLHTLPKTSGKKKIRKGRGDSSSGNYSGRGMKGQRSRSGGKGGLKLRGLKQSMMAMPKNRGFRAVKSKAHGVNLDALEKNFDDGAEVTPAALEERGLVTSATKPVKILGGGSLSKKLTIKAHAVSATAKQAIEAAGGSFTAIERSYPEKLVNRRLKNKKKK